MVHAADEQTPVRLEEEDEVPTDFEVLVDEPHFSVVRVNGIVVAEAHTPLDLSELGYTLAAMGYMADELIAFHDGVIEMKLRELGNVEGIPESDKKIYEQVNDYMKEKEAIYA